MHSVDGWSSHKDRNPHSIECDQLCWREVACLSGRIIWTLWDARRWDGSCCKLAAVVAEHVETHTTSDDSRRPRLWTPTESWRLRVGILCLARTESWWSVFRPVTTWKNFSSDKKTWSSVVKLTRVNRSWSWLQCKAASRIGGWSGTIASPSRVRWTWWRTNHPRPLKVESSAQQANLEKTHLERRSWRRRLPCLLESAATALDKHDDDQLQSLFQGRRRRKCIERCPMFGDANIHTSFVHSEQCGTSLHSRVCKIWMDRRAGPNTRRSLSILATHRSETNSTQFHWDACS